MVWILRVKDTGDLEYFDTREDAMQSLWDHAKEWRGTCPEYAYYCTAMSRDEEIEASGVEYTLTECSEREADLIGQVMG